MSVPYLQICSIRHTGNFGPREDTLPTSACTFDVCPSGRIGKRAKPFMALKVNTGSLFVSGTSWRIAFSMEAVPLGRMTTACHNAPPEWNRSCNVKLRVPGFARDIAIERA